MQLNNYERKLMKEIKLLHHPWCTFRLDKDFNATISTQKDYDSHGVIRELIYTHFPEDPSISTGSLLLIFSHMFWETVFGKPREQILSLKYGGCIPLERYKRYKRNNRYLRAIIKVYLLNRKQFKKSLHETYNKFSISLNMQLKDINRRLRALDLFKKSINKGEWPRLLLMVPLSDVEEVKRWRGFTISDHLSVYLIRGEGATPHRGPFNYKVKKDEFLQTEWNDSWKQALDYVKDRNDFPDSLLDPSKIGLYVEQCKVFNIHSIDIVQKLIINFLEELKKSQGKVIGQKDETNLKTINISKDIEKAKEKLIECICSNKKHEIASLEEIENKYLKYGKLITTNGPEMKIVCDIIEKVSKTKAIVLLQGETGVGKEVVARSIHNLSKFGRLIKKGIKNLPKALLDTELFGSCVGAYTNALERPGLFESSSGNTLFLDELGKLKDEDSQSKLLTIIEDKNVCRLGGLKHNNNDRHGQRNTDHTNIPFNIHLIIAAKENLEELVEQKLFLEDLFYRINEIPIEIPPLRKRREDIWPLFQYLIRKQMKEKNNIDLKYVSNSTKLFIEKDYNWMGNIRELEKLCIRIVTLLNKDTIDLCDLTKEIQRHCKQYIRTDINNNKGKGVEQNKEESESIIYALACTGWNQEKASEIAGLKRPTFINRMEIYNIPKKL